MPRKTSDDKLAEMTDLRDRSIAIIRFIGELDSPSDLLKDFEQVITQTFDKGDLRGLRMVAKDMLEWAGGLSAKDQQKLDELLVARFGNGLKDARKETRKEVTRILKRGQITNEDQYRLLMAHVDDIYADESKAEELKKINSLLLSFEPD